ncbi:MAG: hypothetical protein GY841_10300 [FCB group bacterium]|nr:hypothetical protein [FCB group bacterium]
MNGTITPADLAAVLQANGGDFRETALRAAFDMSKIAVTRITHWLDHEGFTEVHGRRRKIAPGLTLDYVVAQLTAREGVKFERSITRTVTAHYETAERRRPRLRVLFDPAWQFDGLVLSRDEIRKQLEKKIPFVNDLVCRWEPKRGRDMLCYTYGIHVYKVTPTPWKLQEVTL